MTHAIRRHGVAVLCLLMTQTGAAGRERRASAGAVSVSVVHYDVHLMLDVGQGRVSGTAVLTVVGRGGDADSVQLDSGDLIVDKAALEGRDVRFSSADHRLVVYFPRAIRDGERRALSVTYHGQPRGGLRFFASEEQAYTAFSTSQWLICVDAPDQKATLRLSVTGPEGWVATGSGTAVERGARSSSDATHEWVLETPVSTYLFGFAIGRFRAATEIRHGVRLIYLGVSYSDAELRSIFKDTPDILTFFEARAGVRYRGTAYTQVLAAGRVEQEVGMFTLLSADYGRSLLADPHDVWLEAHEFAHQWWGNGVTCRDWNHFWLNEGLASFMADAYKEHRLGRAAYQTEIEASRARYERVRAAGHDRALVFPDWSHPSAEDRVLVYHKGAYVLHLLRERLGEHRFWEGIRDYTRAYMGKSVTTADFQKAMERASGADLTDFFNQWIYSADGGV
jgi:aminopeptidase N